MSANRSRLGRPPLDESQLWQRKERILNGTLDLVAEVGADNVNLRAVAQVAGVSVGALQHYFGTRGELLRHAFTLHSQRVIARLGAADLGHDDPWDRIESMVHAFTVPEEYRLNCALWLEFAAVAARDPELRVLMGTTYETWCNRLLSAVTDGTRSGAFAPLLDVESVVMTLLATIDGYEVALALRVTGATPETVAERLLDLSALLLSVDRRR